MVRRVVWAPKAEIVFQEILKFYFLRNGTKIFSKKLDSEIRSRISLLSKLPFLGITTNIEGVRFLLSSHYKIFYKVDENSITILMVWDTRQDPNKFKT